MITPDGMRLLIAEIDARLIIRGLRKRGQTVDLTKTCTWTPTGRDGQGRRFLTCVIHGETKVVNE